jgi:hypothetical protein
MWRSCLLSNAPHSIVSADGLLYMFIYSASQYWTGQVGPDGGLHNGVTDCLSVRVCVCAAGTVMIL